MYFLHRLTTRSFDRGSMGRQPAEAPTTWSSERRTPASRRCYQTWQWSLAPHHFPEFGADQKSRSTLEVYTSIPEGNWSPELGFEFLDPPRGLGKATASV